MANSPANRQHKAATDVTVAPIEERSGLEEVLFGYWKPAVGLFVVVAAVIWFLNRQEEQEAAAADQSWARLSQYLGFVEGRGEQPDVAGLEAVAVELEGTLAGPWADALLAPAYVQLGDYSKAKVALEQFMSEHPNHPLADPAMAGEGGAALLAERLAALDALKSARPELFDNAAPAPDAPRVRLNTSAGPITIALYPDRAPGHVENFLEKVGSGVYDGTKFHRVIEGFMVQAGDPNSVDGPQETWGQGGGDVTQSQEFSDLAHFPGYLSMAKRGDQVDSGTFQFFITLGAPHHLDGQHTVFGKVVDGMANAQLIGAGSVEPGTDRPMVPVVIESAEVIG